MKIKLLILIVLVSLFAIVQKPEVENAPKWWKGNLHMHSTWDDGDADQNKIVKWYMERGYNFVSFTTHDGIGDKKVLSKVKNTFDRKGKFMTLNGEEISGRYINENKSAPVHIIVINAGKNIFAQWGTTAIETIQNNLQKINELTAESKNPIYVHIAHPNMGWAIMADDLYQIPGNLIIEIYNGYHRTWSYGDDSHPSVEQIWDEVNTRKLRGGLGIVYGVAVDDAHHYSDFQLGNANPGRGWVVVRSKKLDAKSIITALNSGDFYSSSGVTLEDIVKVGKKIKIKIKGESGVTYKTEFIGEMGKVKKTDTSLTPEYELVKNDLYVRARITSSKLKENPPVAGAFEKAWTQPMTP